MQLYNWLLHLRSNFLGTAGSVSPCSGHICDRESLSTDWRGMQQSPHLERIYVLSYQLSWTISDRRYAWTFAYCSLICFVIANQGPFCMKLKIKLDQKVFSFSSESSDIAYEILQMNICCEKSITRALFISIKRMRWILKKIC